jgi:hypothetical protein
MVDFLKFEWDVLKSVVRSSHILKFVQTRSERIVVECFLILFENGNWAVTLTLLYTFLQNRIRTNSCTLYIFFICPHEDCVDAAILSLVWSLEGWRPKGYFIEVNILLRGGGRGLKPAIGCFETTWLELAWSPLSHNHIRKPFKWAKITVQTRLLNRFEVVFELSKELEEGIGLKQVEGGVFLFNSECKHVGSLAYYVGVAKDVARTEIAHSNVIQLLSFSGGLLSVRVGDSFWLLKNSGYKSFVLQSLTKLLILILVI